MLMASFSSGIAMAWPIIIVAAPTNLAASSVQLDGITLNWNDNADNETGFSIEMDTGSGFSRIAAVGNNVTKYVCTGLNQGTKYWFRVKALGDSINPDSEYSNVATVTTPRIIVTVIKLSAPFDFKASATTASSIKLSWTDNSKNEIAYCIERKLESGTYVLYATLPANATSYQDTGLNPGTTYDYRVRGIGNGSNILDSEYTISSATTPVSIEPLNAQKVLRFLIGSTQYLIDEQVLSMDTAPAIVNGRTLLPISYVATPLGASFIWNEEERKVTLSFQDNNIELWIDQSIAKVNGINTYIDPRNPEVAPQIVNGHTLLPLSFVALHLNCGVQWLPTNREVIVTYPKN
jgi:titin